jgi:DNA-binding Lrp family transcriptional regulator
MTVIRDENTPLMVDKKQFKAIEAGLEGNPQYGPPRSGIYYVIPAWIMDAEELEPMAKLLFALISGLSDHQGVSFPSDKYLAGRLKVSERQVQELLKQLEKFEIIKRETFNCNLNPFKKKRRIHLSIPSFKKSLRNEQACGSDQNTRASIVSEAKLVSEDLPLPPSLKVQKAFACLGKQKLKKKKISLGYSEQEFEEAWKRYEQNKTPVGYVESWIDTTLESIRLGNEAQAHIDKRSEKKLKEELQNRLEMEKKIKHTWVNNLRFLLMLHEV